MKKKINCDGYVNFNHKSAFKFTVICRRVVRSCCETRLKDYGIGRFNIISQILQLVFYLYFCFQNLSRKASRAGRIC